MTPPTWPRYLLWMLATLLATIALCAAVNLLIDPLGIFGAPRIAGVNATKPYLDHHRDLARWQAARRLCPSAGIFGNSRAEIGFDPDHPAFRRLGLEAFNHAIPSANIVTAVSQLNWLRAAGCAPKLVILGVEFFDFLGAPAAGAGTRATPPPVIDLRTLGETVFSLTALRDSVHTVVAQRARFPATISPRGFNPLLNYIPEVEHSGHYALFRQRAMENFSAWARKPPRIHPDGGPSIEFAGLDAFLATAAESAGTVHLVIYPYHAQIRLMMERAGLNGLFAEWKAALVAASRRVAGHGATVRLWDFSGLSAETEETIPPRGDRRTRLTYFWEAGHFKKALGDRVLDQILLGEPGFGVPLHASTLAAWLAQDQARINNALTTPSSLLREVDSLLGQGPATAPDRMPAQALVMRATEAPQQ